MGRKSIVILVCLAVLAYFISFAVTKYINYKYSDKTVDITIKNNVKKIESEKVNVSEILELNPFNLKKEEKQITQVSKVAEKTTEVNTDINFELLGYVANKDKVLALIKINSKTYVLNNKEPVDGFIVDKIIDDYLVILHSGKSYKVKLVGGSKKTENTTAVKTKPVQENKASKSDTFKISRQEVDKQLKDINSLLRTIFVAPYYRNKEFLGYRIARIRKNSILYKLGLRNGDVIVRINDESVENPQKMLELLTNISDVTAVKVDLIRRGVKKSIFVEIE